MGAQRRPTWLPAWNIQIATYPVRQNTLFLALFLARQPLVSSPVVVVLHLRRKRQFNCNFKLFL